MFSKQSGQAAALMCLVVFATATYSQNSPSSLDTIVVTPGREAQLEREVVGDVSVISSYQLQAAGQTSVADVLAQQPGIQIYSTGGPQTYTGVFLRGTNPNQTLVLIDGMPVNSPMDGGVNWNVLDPNLIDRIEIVRGAASSLYGSSAMGGVINILTQPFDAADKPLSIWGNLGYGSYDTFKAGSGFSGAKNGWSYAFSGFLEDSAGFNASRPESGSFTYNPNKNGYERHGVNGSLGYSWAPGHRTTLRMLNSYTQGSFDDGPYTDAYTYTRQQVWSLSSEHAINSFWTTQLRFGFIKNSSESRDSWPSEYQAVQRVWSWQNTFRLSESQSLTALLERKEERVAHSTHLDTSDRTTRSAALIYKGQYGGLRTQASVRNDNISGYGNKGTGSIAADYHFNENWSAGVAANTGFRAPGFDQLYWPGFSNPDLKPEKSRNAEANLRYANDTTSLRASVYHNRIQNLILNDDTGPINIGRAKIQGISLVFNHAFSNDTRIQASADFMNPKDEQTGQQLVRRARQVYRFNINQRVDNWDLGAEYMYVGKRYDAVFDETTFATVRKPLGHYSLLNLTARYDFNSNMAVQLRWNNVFNRDYVNAYGYNTPGSNVFLNLSWKM